jgi:multisubunit Na+/H+ antiporter MnhF subunit
VVMARGTLADAVVGYEFITTIMVLVLALIVEGFGRSGLFELPVLLALLLYGSGLVFVRSLERWL